MPVVPPVLTPADLASGGAELPLTSNGAPYDALALVDLSTDRPAQEVLERARRAASTSSRVLVGVSDGRVDPALDGLASELAVTLCPTGAAGRAPSSCAQVLDVQTAVDQLAQQVGCSPRAAVTLIGLLRLTAQVPVPDGLVAESLAYSMLLAGPEFASWRTRRTQRTIPEPLEPTVLVERSGGRLTITLNRPQRHNAYGRRVRDGLVEALQLAVLAPDVDEVHLRGAGPSFSSGGDLDEFGTTPDVATAHVVRLERSAAALLHQCAGTTTAHVHGACIGAGVELSAFAGRVVARPDARFALPELQMGLVPGAGGTVSLPRRIGRWRTAYLALSGVPVDVATALAWGLVDARADA